MLEWQLKLVSSSENKHLHLVIAACPHSPVSYPSADWCWLNLPPQGSWPTVQDLSKPSLQFQVKALIKIVLNSLTHSNFAALACIPHSGWSLAEVIQKRARAVHSVPQNLITAWIFINPSKTVNLKDKNVQWQMCCLVFPPRIPLKNGTLSHRMILFNC